MSTLTAGPESTDVLSVRNVSAGYGPYRALFNVSFRVPDRGIVALVGSNGAGKSTIARTVTGLVTASEGQIIFSGQDITALPAYKIARLGMAHVVEGRGVFSSLTVEENLQVGGVVRSGAETRETLADIYALFPRLGERRRQVGGTLSGGEQQMLAIGRALMSRPDFILMDEPSLGLAPLVVERVFETLAQVRDGGTSILLVEQRGALTVRFADRTHVLCNAELRVTLTPADAESRERLTARLTAAYLS